MSFDRTCRSPRGGALAAGASIIAQARYLLLALLSLLALGGLAVAVAADTPRDDSGLPLWEVRIYTDYPVRIELESPEALAGLLARVPIASFNRDQVRLVPVGPKQTRVEFEPRVTEAEAAALAAAGYTFARLPDDEQAGRRAMETAWAAQATKGGDALEVGEKGVYHTHAQIGQILQQTAIDHSAIATSGSIGNSVQGRALWSIVISDNVGAEEAEPEVRLVSTIHGNEPVGLEMLLYLVDHLTNNYGSDPVVTDLVDNYEIHIIPCINPDGLVLGTRYNANGRDLNRNYPVPDGTIGDDGTYSEEIETQLFKTYGAARHFVISENGHTGALVVNYPWDYTYTLAPDNNALIKLSLEYSTYNLPMYNNPEFPQGITNGAEWYVVHGSLQDWSYHETGCIDVTIELSNTFAPPASQLDQLWNENRESLLHYVKAARYGVNGVVTAAGSGQPLAATVTVTGNTKSVTTDPDFGDYYKLLDTGTYSLTFTAVGYTPQTISGVSTTWGTSTVLNVQLQPVAYGDVAGHVRNNVGQGLTASIAVRTYPLDEPVTTVASNGGADGAYTVHLMYGSYTFTVTCAGYATARDTILVDEANESADFVLLPVEEAVLVADDLEAGAGNWTGAWGIVTNYSHSATHSMTDSPGGNYANNANSACTLTDPFSLATASTASLSFWARWALETNWDCVVLEVSTNGGVAWTPVPGTRTVAASGQGGQTPAGIPCYEGTQTAWVEETVDLTAYLGQPDVRFRFRLRSDTSQVYDGFYFDDFEVRVTRPAVSDVPANLSAVLSLASYPNPFNPATTLRFATAVPGRVELALFDLQGRHVRTLLDENLPAGGHVAQWDGRDDRDQALASGIYFARLRAGDQRRTEKLMLLK